MLTTSAGAAPAELEPFLRRRAVDGAYLLGDLDPSYLTMTTWYAARYQGDVVAVLLVFDGGEPVLLSQGAPDGVAEILRAHAAGLPRTAAAKIPLEHREGYLRHYSLSDEVVMWSMGLEEGHRLPPATSDRAVSLAAVDAADTLALFNTESPHHFFEADRMGSSLYVGIRDSSRLVAVAGTHVVSAATRAAVIGDVVTSRSHRGRGLARDCVTSLVRRLLEAQIRTISLQVSDSNTAAIATYRSVGFAYSSTVLQASCSTAGRSGAADPGTRIRPEGPAGF